MQYHGLQLHQCHKIKNNDLGQGVGSSGEVNYWKVFPDAEKSGVSASLFLCEGGAVLVDIV